MKKSFVITCLIVVFSLLGIIWFGVTVTSQDEQVFLTEEVLVGDKSAAEDIRFQINSHWEQKLLWETVTEIGQETVSETEFSFYPEGFVYESPGESEAEIEYNAGFDYSSTHNLLTADDSVGVPYIDVFVDIASRTKPGEERTETVRLTDYYTYFDFHMTSRSDRYLGRYTSDGEDEDDIISKVLAIRLPEKLELEATVNMDEKGRVYTVNCNMRNLDIHVESGGTVLQDGVYMYVFAEDEHRSLMPGYSDTGYGIYKIPITWEKDNGGNLANVHIKEFALVYPLEKRILALEPDSKEEELFVLAEDRAGLVLQRVNKDTMELMQEFPLEIAEKGSVCQDMQVTEDGVFLLMDDGRIYYAQKTGDHYEITVRFDLKEIEGFTGNEMWRQSYAFAYQDSRLAVVWSDLPYIYDRYREDGNSAYVMLLEGKELMYLAHYQNSLDIWDRDYQYANELHPGEPFLIEFVK